MSTKPCPFCGLVDDHTDDCYFTLKAAGAMIAELQAAWDRRVDSGTARQAASAPAKTFVGYIDKTPLQVINEYLHPPAKPDLTVWEGAMPESNGKSNFTAILMRKDGKHWDNMTDGITIERSEYPDRVRYEADRVRYLIGELAERPCILDYDANKHSGYIAPTGSAAATIAAAKEE